MKPKTLLLLAMTSFIIVASAQNKQKPVTGYAITASEKGGRNWKEVRMVDMITGEVIKSIYQSTTETEALNARTKKPVVKKEINGNTMTTATPLGRKIVNLDEELNKANTNPTMHFSRQVVVVRIKEQSDKPFATNSAAMAYDKKHDRLYYTPMGINQLRYIDLKSNKIYYFENESFGNVKVYGDAANQITRMVIASDGDGYALSNDGNHLLRFTTGKKPTITDLGAISDDAKNGNFSVRNPGTFGGDMIADVNENLYLITANRSVFKIAIETKAAEYLGNIKGLPRGFSTNGAMVEEGSKVIVASSESTEGYYRFDLNTLQAEKISAQGNVFNASDLANGNLAFDKKKKDKKQEAAVAEQAKQTTVAASAGTRRPETSFENNISVYPNPVTNGTVKVSFNDLPAGKYQVQLVDLSGRLISSQEVTLNNKLQVSDITIPEVSKGNYLIKIVSEPNKVSVTSKLVVQ
jgi:hypothetical protein